MIWTNIS